MLFQVIQFVLVEIKIPLGWFLLLWIACSLLLLKYGFFVAKEPEEADFVSLLVEEQQVTIDTLIRQIEEHEQRLDRLEEQPTSHYTVTFTNGFLESEEEDLDPSWIKGLKGLDEL